MQRYVDSEALWEYMTIWEKLYSNYLANFVACDWISMFFHHLFASTYTIITK